MKGDFTRFTHRPARRYTGVLKQQGRVDLDADWNEYVAIQDHLEREVNIDVIGHCGVPIHGGGFAIGVAGGAMTISAGRIYVAGILVEQARNLTYTTQPDLPDPPPLPAPAAGRTDLVYLDVWQRHITAIEDPAIREIALGGPDTTTRVQTVAQVRVLPDVGDISCRDNLAAWERLVAPSGARLSSAVIATPDPEDPCLLPPGGGYSGLENRLYRVEIHAGSAAPGGPTFKWSRDNGAVVFAVEEFIAGEPTRIRVARLGRDQELSLRVGDWVEVLGDSAELNGRPGTLARIEPNGIDQAERILTLSVDVSAHSGEGHPRVRRWDQASDALPAVGGPIDLEEGIQVTFGGADYRSGDYWAFAARVADRSVEVLTDAPPQGIRHYFCRLALITWEAGGEGPQASVRDCRRPFPPLTELPTGDDCCTLSVGDGVSSVGAFSDIQAAVDALPPQGGRVCVLPGDYRPRATVLIRRDGVIVSGCGQQTRIIAPGAEPAFRVEGARLVALESLTIAARSARGAVFVISSRQVRVSDCGLLNAGDRQAESAAILVTSSAEITLRANQVQAGGGWACSLQARRALLEGNSLSGGVWVRDSSGAVAIGENTIGPGEGPGVALGGLAADDGRDERETGIVGVEIWANTIRGMTGSGVSTVARRTDADSLGNIEGLTIHHNSITGCARRPPDPTFDAQAVGGVVLRNTAQVRIHANQIAGNGGGEVLACGVFTYLCLGLELTDNEIVDNGGAPAAAELQCVDFAAMQPGRGPNPREEQGVRFEVFGPNGTPQGNTQISAIGGLTGLNAGFQVEIALPAAVPSVELTLVHFSSPPRVEAFNSDGSSAGTATAGTAQGVPHVLSLGGAAITRVVVTPPQDEALLQRFCFGAAAGAPATFQAGIAALLVVGGEVTLGERASFRAGRAAARIHDNTVVCPLGHALLAVALGPLSVADNTLVSQGVLAQPGELGRTGRCVEINNMGRDPLLSNSFNRIGVRTFVRASSLAAAPRAAAAPELPDGRVSFHGNQVTLEVLDELAGPLSSSVFIQSLDDIALHDNQFIATTPAGAVFAQVGAAAPTVRAAGNRFSELPNRAAFSYVANGTLNSATGNQATHCINLLGAQVVEQQNQVILTANCERLTAGLGLVAVRG